MKSTDGILLVGFALIGYIAYKFFSESKEKTEEFIADAIIRFTLPEPVGVKGAAILPNGAAVPMTSLRVLKVSDKDIYYFDWQGKRYQLGPRSAQGNWPARIM